MILLQNIPCASVELDLCTVHVTVGSGYPVALHIRDMLLPSLAIISSLDKARSILAGTIICEIFQNETLHCIDHTEVNTLLHH